jgi:aminoglycoside phosphotransferase (APT) family kinase protein
MAHLFLEPGAGPVLGRSTNSKVDFPMPQPIGRDLKDTRDRLVDWLADRLPGARRLRVEDLRGPKDTGFSSDTLMFHLHYEENGNDCLKEMVIRLEPAGDFGLFPEYDVALQYNMMKALADTRVPVPEMYWLEEDPAFLGNPFYVMERLDGQVPSDSPPYHSEGWLFDSAPEDRERLWNSGLDAMSEVHKLDWRKPEFAFLKPLPPGRTSIQAQLDYWDSFLDWGLDRSRYSLINAGFEWLVAHQPPEAEVGICWGDARISNQIFRSHEAIAVIDWEMVFVGNPVADLAWFITLDRVLTEGIGLDRLVGVPGKDASIARWEQSLGRPAKDYAYYEIFAAWRFAVIMARIFLQMKHYEVLPQEAPADVENLSTPILRSLLEAAPTN